METAGIVLGAVPVIVEVIKSWKTVHRKLHTLRHYVREIRKIYDRIKVQYCVFENELERLLLSSGITQLQAESMMVNLEHPSWTEPEDREKIRLCLGKDAGAYQQLVEGIAEALDAMTKQLTAFDGILEQRSKDERPKDIILRLRLAMKVSFKKSDYDAHVESLRQDLADLRVIGSYRAKRETQRLRPSTDSAHPPDSSGRIHTASRALYEALSTSWSCSNPDHTQHAAKLCLAAAVDDSVRLDLALSCKRQSPVQPSTAAPLWLYVRSLTSTSECPETPSLDSGGRTIAPVLADATGRRKRPKTVSIVATPHVGRDLRGSPSFCESLAQCRCLTHSEECLGYIEDAEMPANRLRHLFYHQCTQQPGKPDLLSELDLPTLMEARKGVLTPEEQLQMAVCVAKSVLQFHATPWLGNEWRLKDILVFKADQQSMEQAFKTMHVTTEFDRENDGPAFKVTGCVQSQTSDSSSSLESQNCSDQQVLYGVPNLVLFSLGIALLEIGHGRSLESFKADRDPNNTFTARRLAQRPTLLGQKYQLLAQRCLRCDFGAGSDLEAEQLRDAVYTDVVCQLDGMLRIFRI